MNVLSADIPHNFTEEENYSLSVLQEFIVTRKKLQMIKNNRVIYQIEIINFEKGNFRGDWHCVLKLIKNKK